jgi:hypothetical protein
LETRSKNPQRKWDLSFEKAMDCARLQCYTKMELMKGVVVVYIRNSSGVKLMSLFGRTVKGNGNANINVLSIANTGSYLLLRLPDFPRE